MNDKVVVSFPLRYSDLVTYVKKLIDSGKIGRVQHIEAINNVPYGRVYYHKWYRDENETGGLFLQKSTHDLDYINYIIGDRRPVSVCAISSKQIFKGDKPAGMLCADCNETATCPESPQNVKTYGDNYPIGPYCCFAKDTGNQESGPVLVSYDDGMHVCYTQNFITRNGAARRGAIIVGYLGPIEFDFYTGQVKFFHHTDGNIETLDIKSTGLHHGGDGILAKNFIDVMENKDVSHATLKDGILSAELCLAAKRSARDRVFVNIEN
jgi:predicted dehydrogenase